MSTRQRALDLRHLPLPQVPTDASRPILGVAVPPRVQAREFAGSVLSLPRGGRWARRTLRPRRRRCEGLSLRAVRHDSGDRLHEGNARSYGVAPPGRTGSVRTRPRVGRPSPPEGRRSVSGETGVVTWTSRGDPDPVVTGFPPSQSGRSPSRVAGGVSETESGAPVHSPRGWHKRYLNDR